MAESHVLSALRDKRARLAGELVRANLRVIALKADLSAVDRCLKLFGCEVEPFEITPKVTFGKSGLPKGSGSRMALEILRETGESMSSQELAACILQRLGRPMEPRPFEMLVKTIHSNFSRRKDGLVEFDRGTYPGKWRLVSAPSRADIIHHG